MHRRSNAKVPLYNYGCLAKIFWDLDQTSRDLQLSQTPESTPCPPGSLREAGNEDSVHKEAAILTSVYI
jgi:hypothetical protein